MRWIGGLAVAFWAIGALGQSPSFASTMLEVPTNTGIQQLKFKNVACGTEGNWQFDLVNNTISETRIEYVFWLEDEDGDSIEGARQTALLEPKSRIAVALPFSCETPFTALRHQFHVVPLGMDRH
ncbi:MAG: hypothetical protein O2981_01655 [Proteobacteria bacterium]|nr:hypothetical protein [Pseudomonadota bacterium]